MMDSTAYVALSRQVALMRELDVTATNVANINTTGFKAEHTLFETVLQNAGVPNGLAFVQDVGTARDLSPGPLIPTGNPLDVAVDGRGWLAFGTPGGTLYGRVGHLAVSATGALLDASGNALLDDGGAAIALPANEREITIAADGTISGRNGVVGRIGLSSFANEQTLVPAGGGLWRASQPAAPADGRLVQGMLEGANVEPVLEMTRMIETQRAFDGTQRLIDVDHELSRKSVDALLGSGRA
jgi:flagellar basal-body rod protein FlgF